jgi:hypothetical protein
VLGEISQRTEEAVGEGDGSWAVKPRGGPAGNRLPLRTVECAQSQLKSNPTPDDLRARLEVARLDLLALFRALDRMHLSPVGIPQGFLRQLFGNLEKDADYAEALWALTSPRQVWIAAPCSAISVPYWTNRRQRAPVSETTTRPCPSYPGTSGTHPPQETEPPRRPKTRRPAEIPNPFKRLGCAGNPLSAAPVI